MGSSWVTSSIGKPFAPAMFQSLVRYVVGFMDHRIRMA